MLIPEPWFNFAVALTTGLLIGVERERTKGEGPDRRPAGIRTFAMTALLGAIATHVGGITLLAVASIGVAGLTALSYVRRHDPDPGLTTEIGLLGMPLLGGLAMSEPLLAAGLAVLVAVLFAAKQSLHGFATNVLTAAEVRDGLIFAVATLVVWPLLPDRYLGPMQALNPYSIWMLVVLVLTLGACGHIATRLIGHRFGLPVAGLASGFVSSTATIGSMAGRAARDPGSVDAAAAGAALSTVATFVQLGLLLLATDRPTFMTMLPALLAGGGIAAVYGFIVTLRGVASQESATPEVGRTFSIGAALALATIMATMLVAGAVLKDWFGDSGVVIGAAIAGFVDTHAAAISIASLVASTKLVPEAAVVPILAAMTTNAVAKIVMATATGPAGFALRVVPGIIVSMAAAWAAAGLVIL